MHAGRRSGEPALRRALLPAAGALLLASGSCSDASDASDRELLELNRERDDVQLLGGQTGDGTGVAEGEGRETLDAPCADATRSRPLLHDELAAEVGFAADDVLAWVRGGVSASLGWAPDGAVETRPEAGRGSVALSFSFHGAGVRLLTPEASEPSGAAPRCSPWLEVDVSATLTTPGGAFDERFAVTLRAARPRVVGFGGRIAASELTGRLELASARGAAALEGFEVAGVLTEPGSFGVVRALYLEPESGLLEADTVAAWPAPSECPAGAAGTGVPVADDARLIERSVAEWKRALSGLEVQPLAWSDGARTRVALDVQPRSVACYTTGWALPDESLRYGVQILALSEDGRWDAGYLGTARIGARALPNETTAALRATAVVPSAEAERLGVALPGSIDAESITLDLQIARSLRPEGPLQGELRLTASRALACSERPEAEADSCLVESMPTLTSARLGERASD